MYSASTLVFFALLVIVLISHIIFSYCVAGLSFQVLKFCRPSKYRIINFVYNNRCAHNALTKHILQNLLAQLPWWLHNSAAIGLSAMNRSTGPITNTISFSVTSYIGTPSCSRNKFSTIGSAGSIASTLFEQHVKCMLLCFALSCRGRPNYKRKSLNERHQGAVKGLSTREAGRGHATPHMPVETAKCWWLLKIEPNAWAGGKGSCAVCIDLQAVGALEFFGELYKGFGPFLRGV